jgi:acylphosphatase
MSTRAMIGAAVLTSCLLVEIATAPAKSNVSGQNIAAVSGVVSGSVQQVGFRAMIQKQAIMFNLAGSTKNNDDKTVQFSLQGDKNRVNQALAAIRDGTKKSSNVESQRITGHGRPNSEHLHGRELDVGQQKYQQPL